jgi:hypothetical protein
MSSEHDASPAPRSGMKWVVIGIVAVAFLGAAALLGVWFLAGRTAEPVASVTPAPAQAAAPAPEVDTPTATIEASRTATPRSKKKVEPAAPPPPPEPAAPTTGELHIDSDVPGAMVFLDRKFVGNAPVTVKDVSPGTHQLNVTAEGHEGYSEPIEVAAGPADVLVKFREIRLKASADVVHKHAIGSCEGRLLADPQGVRYETANKDDAFTMTFSEIETFEVDYLKKNLRIKKRGGKQYNFTTKAENADPLFVFHRDVDKVRQQVAGSAPAKK